MPLVSELSLVLNGTPFSVTVHDPAAVRDWQRAYQSYETLRDGTMVHRRPMAQTAEGTWRPVANSEIELHSSIAGNTITRDEDLMWGAVGAPGRQIELTTFLARAEAQAVVDARVARVLRVLPSDASRDRAMYAALMRALAAERAVVIVPIIWRRDAWQAFLTEHGELYVLYDAMEVDMSQAPPREPRASDQRDVNTLTVLMQMFVAENLVPSPPDFYVTRAAMHVALSPAAPESTRRALRTRRRQRPRTLREALSAMRAALAATLAGNQPAPPEPSEAVEEAVSRTTRPTGDQIHVRPLDPDDVDWTIHHEPEDEPAPRWEIRGERATAAQAAEAIDRMRDALTSTSATITIPTTVTRYWSSAGNAANTNYIA